MSESKGKLIPFYLVVDVSASMTTAGRIDAANDIVGELMIAFEKNPILTDIVRVALIDFSDDARVVIPLDDILELESIPRLGVRGGTSYRAAFDVLRSEIQRNVDELKASGFEVHRPAVYFITDGEPNEGDDWETAFARLTTYDRSTKTGFAYFPNVIPCGVGDATGAVLAPMIHPRDRMKMFLARDGADPAAALPKMIEVIISSLMASAQSVSSSQSGGGIQMPNPDDLPDDIMMNGADDFL